MDLSKTIKINTKYEISYGILLLTFLVTFFECLGIIAMNNWQFHSSVFFLISNTILLVRRRAESSLELDELVKRVNILEEKHDDDIRDRTIKDRDSVPD